MDISTSELKKEAQLDLVADFEELVCLHESYLSYLKDFQEDFGNIKNDENFDFIKKQTEFYLGDLKDRILKVKNDLEKIKEISSDKEIDFYTKQRESFFDYLRVRVGMIGALITSTDWQSPSFEHAVSSQAGIQEGQILAHINDYKRDRHLNEISYQKEFTKEYVDGAFKLPVAAFLTGSGMAALTTILTFLFIDNKNDGPLLIGETIYFQNAELIKHFFREKKVIEVPEMDTEKVLENFDKYQPKILIFDSLSNAKDIAVPNLLEILKHVVKNAKQETFFIIDNSTLSVAFQPLSEVVFNRKVKLIVFESLNKYHQFGLDKVTGGIAWLWGWGLSNFQYARVHAGTNITDSSCYILPKPNRKMLERRLERFKRNAIFLASEISEYLKVNRSKKIGGINFPGLTEHPSFSWSKDYKFTGSYMVINFKEDFQKVSEYEKFVKKVMEIARKKKINIVGGTSFGLNKTRIYLTATDNEFGIPFVRVSVGTENRLEMEGVKDVFIEAVKNF